MLCRPPRRRYAMLSQPPYVGTMPPTGGREVGEGGGGGRPATARRMGVMVEAL